MLLNERFRVEHLPPAGLTLGSDLHTETPVAVLALRLPAGGDAGGAAGVDAVAELKPMLRAAARLRSPGVAELRDAGQYDDRLLLVYDAGGTSVAELLSEHGPLPPTDAAGVTADVGEAVAAIRRAGLQPGSLDVRDLRLDTHGTLRVLPVPAVDRLLRRARDGRGAQAAAAGNAGSPAEPVWGAAEQEADLQALQSLLGQLLGQPPASLTSSAGADHDPEVAALIGLAAAARSPRELRAALRSYSQRAQPAAGGEEPAAPAPLAATGPLPGRGDAPTSPLPAARDTGGPHARPGRSGGWRDSWSATMLLSVLVAAAVLVTGFVVTAR